MAVSFPGKLLGLIEIIAGQADRSYFPRGREIARGQRIRFPKERLSLWQIALHTRVKTFKKRDIAFCPIVFSYVTKTVNAFLKSICLADARSG